MTLLRWLYIVVWGWLRWPMGIPSDVGFPPQSLYLRATAAGLTYHEPFPSRGAEARWLRTIRLRTNDPSLYLAQGTGHAGGWVVASRLRDTAYPWCGSPWLALVAAAEMVERDRRAA